MTLAMSGFAKLTQQTLRGVINETNANRSKIYDRSSQSYDCAVVVDNHKVVSVFTRACLE